MILIILIIIISFITIVGFNKKRRYKKVRPLSKMTKKEFKKAMKDLEIR